LQKELRRREVKFRAGQIVRQVSSMSSLKVPMDEDTKEEMKDENFSRIIFEGDISIIRPFIHHDCKQEDVD
jgi:hypothetical protein